jgi:hypothetical protein
MKPSKLLPKLTAPVLRSRLFQINLLQLRPLPIATLQLVNVFRLQGMMQNSSAI